MKYLYLHNLKKINKKLLFLSFLFFTILLNLYYNNKKYNILMENFKNNFNDYNFSSALTSVMYEENHNPFKIIFMKRDLEMFFTKKLQSISQEIKDNSISSEEALICLKEINNFNVISKKSISDVYSSIKSIQSSSKNYLEGINYYNNNDFTNALNCFSKIEPLDINYESSIIYSNLCKNNIKSSLLNYCNELVKKNYYTKAITLLTENSNLFSVNDFNSYIKDIENKRKNYLTETSIIAEASSKAFTTSILPSNINFLNIRSNTNYLITVNISNQKTYVYKRNNSLWSLLKTFDCSTGIKSEETPCGSFTTKEKGDWFFSSKYNQGGKYWTQITGNILFHSLPYSKDQKTIVDYTLNTPSSHGCIRLNVDDAKWIYDSIPKDTKVIINN